MKIRQLSVFLENRVGRLAGVISQLGQVGADIRAISVADTADFGILRLLVKDVEAAANALRTQGVVCRISNVSVVEVSSKPGGLARVLALLDGAGINIEYMYAVAQSSSPNPLMVFRFSEGEKAVGILQAAGIPVLDEETLYK